MYGSNGLLKIKHEVLNFEIIFVDDCLVAIEKKSGKNFVTIPSEPSGPILKFVSEKLHAAEAADLLHKHVYTGRIYTNYLQVDSNRCYKDLLPCYAAWLRLEVR